MTNKRGSSFLFENVIFIILNILFLIILIIFIAKQGNGAIVLEQSYAKNIALLIDSAKPIMELTINMKDAFDLAEKNGISREEIVKIDGNLVIVKLSREGGYQYSFFKKVEVTAFPDIFPNENYIIKINGYLTK